MPDELDGKTGGVNFDPLESFDPFEGILIMRRISSIFEGPTLIHSSVWKDLVM